MVTDGHPLGELKSDSFHLYSLSEFLWVLYEALNPNKRSEDCEHLTSTAGLSIRVVCIHQRGPVLF